MSALAGASLLVIGLRVDAADQTGGPSVLLYPPWTSGADAVARAGASGARLIRAGRLEFAVLVQPASRGFTARDAGAWMMFDAAGLGGCLSGGVETIDAAAR